MDACPYLTVKCEILRSSVIYLHIHCHCGGIRALLRCNSHTVQLTHLMYAVSGF